MLGASHGQHALHALGFRFRYLMAQLGQPVIAAPLVVKAEVRPVVGFLDQSSSSRRLMMP